MKSSRSSGEIFNVGSGRKISLLEVAKIISNLCLSGKIVINKKTRDNNKRKENISLCSNVDKIKKTLKWFPKVNLNEGLLKTIEYYKFREKLSYLIVMLVLSSTIYYLYDK
jgi:nucleoside-diphosphate-sugar epimerase